MLFRMTSIAVSCLCLISGLSAQTEAKAPEAVNSMCPIGHQAVEADGGSMEFKGQTVGFCCPGCEIGFAEMSEADQDGFIALSLAGRERGTKAHTTPVNAVFGKANVTPYTLTICVVQGSELGSMGDPIVKSYEGREVRFCCAGCPPRFEKDLQASLVGLDAKIVKDQGRFYPLMECLVSDDAFDSEEDGGAIDVVYNNRLVRFCCKGCVSEFKDNPDAYIARLDNAIIIQQSAKYPLTGCPIGGNTIKEGRAINYVHGSRLIRFCCDDCVEDFKADPIPTIQKLDAAWMAMHTKKGG